MKQHNLLHTKTDECVLCFAEKKGKICIDTKKNYVLCKKHSTMFGVDKKLKKWKESKDRAKFR